jgi:PKD repeat protein
MTGLPKSTKMAIIFGGVGILVGVGITFALIKSEVSNEIDQELIGDSKVSNDVLLQTAKAHVRPAIYHKSTLAVGEEGTFSADASGGYPPYSFEWDFGDGSASTTLQNVTHTFTSAGEYKVQLTGIDSKGTHGVISVMQSVVAPQPSS